MIDDTANSVLSAGSRAGIATLLVDTRQLTGTLGVDCALGTTIWCLANEINQTGTGRHTIDITALGVGTTGCWYTGIP